MAIKFGDQGSAADENDSGRSDDGRSEQERRQFWICVDHRTEGRYVRFSGQINRRFGLSLATVTSCKIDLITQVPFGQRPNG